MLMMLEQHLPPAACIACVWHVLLKAWCHQESCLLSQTHTVQTPGIGQARSGCAVSCSQAAWGCLLACDMRKRAAAHALEQDIVGSLLLSMPQCSQCRGLLQQQLLVKLAVLRCKAGTGLAACAWSRTLEREERRRQFWVDISDNVIERMGSMVSRQASACHHHLPSSTCMPATACSVQPAYAAAAMHSLPVQPDAPRLPIVSVRCSVTM